MAHVLLSFEYPSLNGGEQSLLAVIPDLQARGYQFTALAPGEGELANALASHQIEIIPLQTVDSQGVRLPVDELRRHLKTAIQRFQPDLVHANSLSMSRISGPVVSELGVKSIGHLRDILNLTGAAVNDLNQNSRLLAVSQATRDWYLAMGLHGEKTEVLHNGVDLDRFQPRPPNGFLHRELDLPPESSFIGAIGQIGMRKGLDVLLAAAESVFAEVPNGHLLIVGQRYSLKDEALQYEADLIEAAEQDPLSQRVHFLGVREDIPAILNELTLLVHAARQEPLGRVLLEAAASGTAIVATDVGGTSEIFPPDCQAARLVPADDFQALSQEIENLLADEALRGKMGTAARERAETTFGSEQSAAGLARHYAALLA